MLRDCQIHGKVPSRAHQFPNTDGGRRAPCCTSWRKVTPPPLSHLVKVQLVTAGGRLDRDCCSLLYFHRGCSQSLASLPGCPPAPALGPRQLIVTGESQMLLMHQMEGVVFLPVLCLMTSSLQVWQALSGAPLPPQPAAGPLPCAELY